jgi:hypothetical protein
MELEGLAVLEAAAQKIHKLVVLELLVKVTLVGQGLAT